MIKQLNGQLNASKGNYAIVVSRFNEFITSKLLDGAVDCLKRHGAKDEQMTVAWVPGTCEITAAAKKFADSKKFSAIICLGAVIRGQTSHYDYVCQQISRGVAQLNYDSGIAVAFGVITCETLEQAIERAGTKSGNMGASAALSAIEMVDLLSQI